MKKNKKNKKNEQTVESFVKPMTEILENIAGDLLKTMEKTDPEEVVEEVSPVVSNVSEKSIEEVLKDYPDFYEKTKDGDFNFNPSEKYSVEDIIKVLDSLPVKEESIKEEDAKFIVQFIEYCKSNGGFLKDNVKNYLMRLFDTKELGIDAPKVDGILKSFKKTIKKEVFNGEKQSEKEGSRISDFEQDRRIRKLEDEVKKLQKTVNSLIKKKKH